MPAWAGQTIPFAEALDGAAVSVERLDDILDYALLIGNGDVNALVYTDPGNIEMVLTKNDVWDARLDTALDPPLPTLKPIKQLSCGVWPNRDVILPEGVTWEGPDSYHAHPYPCPRACARRVLGTPPRSAPLTQHPSPGPPEWVGARQRRRDHEH